MSKTIIVVNRHRVRSNRSNNRGELQPPIRVSKGKYGAPKYFTEFPVSGKIVYSPNNPLPCGATVWIECNE